MINPRNRHARRSFVWGARLLVSLYLLESGQHATEKKNDFDLLNSGLKSDAHLQLGIWLSRWRRIFALFCSVSAYYHQCLVFEYLRITPPDFRQAKSKCVWPLKARSSGFWAEKKPSRRPVGNRYKFTKKLFVKDFSVWIRKMRISHSGMPFWIWWHCPSRFSSSEKLKVPNFWRRDHPVLLEQVFSIFPSGLLVHASV